ncbi:DUF2156 domain-containing protein [Pelotalea chapellei]|uniref:DUF2156 domain-containing protein n=1 Tax=Pelotalea chapellei TaxID=44671 RepID=A0ABS5UCA1_9BACT|nr:phosphatidylglycerol lysyltransferase domain-containing protein [Pelotalea chapellei]MBT1073320.1 DUF2156 domain-containing protein [Pelotalea chapellei]
MEIPRYPHARAIEIGDKQLLDTVFSEIQPRVSEMSFAGLYLFREAHDYQLTMVADALVVMGVGYDGRSYFLPPLTGDIAGALDFLFADGIELYGADDVFVSRYLRGAIVTKEDRDAFDYLYLREELAALPGNRFHNKKNRINYFTSHHEYKVELFERRHELECLALLDEWRRIRGKINLSGGYEVKAAAEAVVRADELGLAGVVVSVGGIVRAFELGERLNRETAVCHFEKSDPFMDGIAQLVNREFSRLIFQECKYVNREQDLGEAGLRSAKLSYKPIELVKKYRAVLGSS